MKRLIFFLLIVTILASTCAYPALAQESVPDSVIKVSADAYVNNKDGTGDKSNTNFGAEKDIQLKTATSGYTRYSYLKFDISSLKGDDSFTCIDLELSLTFRQNNAGDPQFAVVEIYACDTNWNENSITYNSRPQAGSFVTKLDNIALSKATYAFAVTDYVRSALKEGKNEIAFYIKEASEIAMHIKFASKEAGENAPKLSVYHGTKTDNSKYESEKNEGVNAYIPSKNGLDTIIGSISASTRTLPVSGDTYVSAGKMSDTNFGSEKELLSKGLVSTPTEYYRLPLLKFDISSLDDGDFVSVKLCLNCTDMEKSNIPVVIDLFACDPSWDEKSVTYNTMPKTGEFLATHTVTYKGLNFIDVTDYVRTCMSRGEKQISFVIEGDSADPRRLNFASLESGKIASTLEVSYGGSSIITELPYEGVNPWEQAVERVSAWMNKWEKLSKKPYADAEAVTCNEEEYSTTVKAAFNENTNGYNTAYTDYPTRTIASLKGYTASTSEAELYDLYGGHMGGEKYEATGYFHTKKIGDRWWVIDPLGYPYYRTAVVAVTHGDSDAQKERTLAKYGSLENWAQSTTDRLYALGFNSVGAWSNLPVMSAAENPLSQTKVLYVITNYSADNGTQTIKDGVTGFIGDVLPVFDPAFESYAKSSVQTQVAPYVFSPNIYGWMSDNELSDTPTMLDNALNLDPTDSRLAYSYAAAWTFMYLKTGKTDVTVSDITNELRLEYRAMVFDRYFEIIADALERYAPLHMYMGCRFSANAYRDEYVIRVAGQYCDVISLNYYRVWEPDTALIENLQKWSGVPFVVTEWYAKGMDVWEADSRMTNTSGAGFTVKTQNDRGLFYQNYALKLLECKGCVGFDWFKYWDNDPDNLKTDISNRNSNKGVLSNNGEEYSDLVKYMEELNTQKYSLVKFFDGR